MSIRNKIILLFQKHDLMRLRSPKINEYAFEADELYKRIKNKKITYEFIYNEILDIFHFSFFPLELCFYQNNVDALVSDIFLLVNGEK